MKYKLFLASIPFREWVRKNPGVVNFALKVIITLSALCFALIGYMIGKA